ncbi:hypothetical protein Q3G72_004867 [Acer saccharum]|nr:hypothetical protein Q3G72_004867 [Acer saccharum]
MPHSDSDTLHQPEPCRRSSPRTPGDSFVLKADSCHGGGGHCGDEMVEFWMVVVTKQGRYKCYHYHQDLYLLFLLQLCHRRNRGIASVTSERATAGANKQAVIMGSVASLTSPSSTAIQLSPTTLDAKPCDGVVGRAFKTIDMLGSGGKSSN